MANGRPVSGGDALTVSREVAAATLRRGADFALETEALEVVRALGIGVPRHTVVTDEADDLRSVAIPGRRVVVKTLGVAHKTDVAAVRVVANDPVDIRAAIAGMPDGAGFLIEEFIDHDGGPAGEWLLGVRWTDDFGPVATFGPGGVYAEFLAARDGDGAAVVSPAVGDVAAALSASPAVRLLTEGHRGGAPTVGPSVLVDLLSGILRWAAAAMPGIVEELEINPLVFTGTGPVALDALLRPGQSRRAVPEPRPLEKIGRLLEPRSIAILGVSSGMNPGRVILENVLRSGFPAEQVTVVKPGLESIEGCGCVPALSDLPAPVDLLVLSVDARQVPGLIGEVIERRVAESIIVIPGGLGERSGTEQAAARAAALIRDSRSTDWGGPVVNGGNSLGIRSVPGRFDTFFIPGHKLSGWDSPPSPVAVLSQSGALTLSRLDRLPWLRPSYVVSVGNQIDLTVGDYLEFFAGDPEVAVAACYLEGFHPGDGARFLRAAARIRERGGAVILYRAGRTAAGAGAAASHTAAIAGDYRVTRVLAAAAGVLVAETLADFEDLLMLSVMLRDRRVDGVRVGAVSNAGFECVAFADNLGPLRTGPLSAETVARIEALFARRHIGSIVAVGNPLDLTPMADDALFAEAVDTVLADRGVDVGIAGCVPFAPALQTLPPGPAHAEDAGTDKAVAALLVDVGRRTDKAWVAVVDAGSAYDPLVRILLAAGIPTFRNADRAVSLLGRYCAWRTAGA